jgi:hypothetical protein
MLALLTLFCLAQAGFDIQRAITGDTGDTSRDVPVFFAAILVVVAVAAAPLSRRLWRTRM